LPEPVADENLGAMNERALSYLLVPRETTALNDSATLELTDDDTCVRRKVPLPETITDAPDATVVKVFEDEALLRGVYAKGFGPEFSHGCCAHGQTAGFISTLDDILIFKKHIQLESQELQLWTANPGSLSDALAIRHEAKIRKIRPFKELEPASEDGAASPLLYPRRRSGTT
jgi:hypothetical protein